MDLAVKGKMALVGKIGRYGNPQRYAHGFAVLASAGAPSVNSSVIRVDGGMINSI